uniref:Uncharacterized protein n=1 Tax=Rhizophora mucronata TaxID=61149 RepID=A0A2P2PRL1_RHIMU
MLFGPLIHTEEALKGLDTTKRKQIIKEQ